MSKIVSEKFQVNYPYQANDDASEENYHWVTDKEARAKKMMPGREGENGGDSDSRFSNLTSMYNSLPPGMDIEDQEYTDIRQMDVHGVDDEQVVKDVNPMSLRKGYDRKKLLGTDDMYTREHNDSFYDVVKTDDGEEAFLERNNLLDRM
jgi:hypothetical protein